jgi:hypothetical protein
MGAAVWRFNATMPAKLVITLGAHPSDITSKSGCRTRWLPKPVVIRSAIAAKLGLLPRHPARALSDRGE